MIKLCTFRLTCEKQGTDDKPTIFLIRNGKFLVMWGYVVLENCLIFGHPKFANMDGNKGLAPGAILLR